MTIAPASRITDDQLAELSDRHSIPAEALQVLRHIADLYSGGAIEGDPTQLFTTGHYVWLARRALEQIVARSQQQATAAVPDGWKLVPVEMTPEMVDVALRWGTKRSEWAELLTAAPAAPEPAAQEPIKLSDDVRDFLTAWISSALEDDDHDFARQLETLLGPLYTAPPAAEPLLDKPAKVGVTCFDAGVPARLVIEASQRQYEYEKNPPFSEEQITGLGKVLKQAAEQPDTVPVPRELLERVLSGEECAKAANELRAILGKETV